MIIDNLNLMRPIGAPHKADAPLVVDADRMLPAPIAAQRLQPTAWGHSQIIERMRRIEPHEAPAGLPLDGGKAPDWLILE
jgi:hypothetical protein